MSAARVSPPSLERCLDADGFPQDRWVGELTFPSSASPGAAAYLVVVTPGFARGSCLASIVCLGGASVPEHTSALLPEGGVERARFWAFETLAALGGNEGPARLRDLEPLPLGEPGVQLPQPEVLWLSPLLYEDRVRERPRAGSLAPPRARRTGALRTS